MTKTITRALVIKALKTETLRRRTWFADNQKPGCRVCAVGAVLRHCSFETWARKLNLDLNDLGQPAVKNEDCFGGSQTVVKILLKKKNYLGALSEYFESKHTKKQCIAFVKENFPKSFRLTINR